MTPQEQQREMSRVANMQPQEKNSILMKYGINPNMIGGMNTPKDNIKEDKSGWSY